MKVDARRDSALLFLLLGAMVLFIAVVSIASLGAITLSLGLAALFFCFGVALLVGFDSTQDSPWLIFLALTMCIGFMVCGIVLMLL